ncbi:APSES transcription factor [Mycena indigotica]|uniref:APSES transcription factor n=1 Tax=Mycena indigotica TaxID=2126181 RepID=A0A8H6T995_9AGAR|nr:APSES transcription factor [Mycena indigotica]KAF7312297.1 APSES transcription factor [Mycena indigotica]
MSSRPALPSQLANTHIASLLQSGTIPPVKYQILNVQGGTEILVGRLKVDTPTPSGHAFILRRYDTGAVSLTTMFRAAYPMADAGAYPKTGLNTPTYLPAPESEKREFQWVKENYDLSGNNGSSRDPSSIPRLAGTWVSTDVAIELGEAYSLGELIHSVVEAQPDPNANYRRSGKGKDGAATTPSKTLPTPPRASPNPPTKRRKEASPAPAPLVVSPRRSARTKSPKPASQPIPSLTSVVKASKKSSRRTEVETLAGSDETAVDDDAGVAAVEGSASSELREEDLAEQRKLISDLKEQRDKARSDVSKTVKRAREDEDKPLAFDFKEPQVGERVIATNSRISPSQKSAVWGVMAFAFGVTAASFLPNLF